MTYIYVNHEERLIISNKPLTALRNDCVEEGRPILEIDFENQKILWKDHSGSGEWLA